jgi:hypothetical protein
VAGLTLDRTVRLLRSALADREPSVQEAIALMEYHIVRNATAKASHDKTWYAKHKDVKFVLL